MVQLPETSRRMNQRGGDAASHEHQEDGQHCGQQGGERVCWEARHPRWIHLIITHNVYYVNHNDSRSRHACCVVTGKKGETSMGRRRRRIAGWTWNDERQELKTPTGHVITLDEITTLLADHRECRIDFTGPWIGWRMRHQFLIPPGTARDGPKITPQHGRYFARWVHEPSQWLDRGRSIAAAGQHTHQSTAPAQRWYPPAYTWHR